MTIAQKMFVASKIEWETLIIRFHSDSVCQHQTSSSNFLDSTHGIIQKKGRTY